MFLIGLLLSFLVLTLLAVLLQNQDHLQKINIDIKISLSPPTQLLFTVSPTNSKMNFANMYLFLT